MIPTTLHLHIAINKIHPTRLTIHSPYNDHKTLGKLCAALELQYGLERDNHQAVRVGSENRALDMEHHAGVESLLGWIKRECLEQRHVRRLLLGPNCTVFFKHTDWSCRSAVTAWLFLIRMA